MLDDWTTPHEGKLSVLAQLPTTDACALDTNSACGPLWRSPPPPRALTCPTEARRVLERHAWLTALLHAEVLQTQVLVDVAQISPCITHCCTFFRVFFSLHLTISMCPKMCFWWSYTLTRLRSTHLPAMSPHTLVVMLMSLAFLGSEAAPVKTNEDASVESLSAKLDNHIRSLSVHETKKKQSTCNGGGGPSCGNWFTENHCGVGETCGHSNTDSWCCPVGWVVPDKPGYFPGFGDGPGHCFSVDSARLSWTYYAQSACRML